MINFTPQHITRRKEPLISIEWEAGWGPQPVWAFEEINCLPLPKSEQFVSHLLIINCASLATEIMVAF
jgi:hypothetical protein